MGPSPTIQSHTAGATEQETYQLIVFSRPGTAVLLETRALGYALPVVEIPRFTRSAQEITEILRDRLRSPSVLLFSGPLKENSDSVYFAALEVQGRNSTAPKEMDWFPVHHAISHLLKDSERNVLEASYFKATNRVAGEDPEPFSRLGWMSNLQNWVRTVIGPLGMELKDFQQLNGCETFSLIRFDTTHGPVWFKAVGHPNLHEYGISQALAKLLPKYVPNTLATKPEWHGWLMSDGIGITLDELEDLSAWQTAVTSLAGLQIESIGRTDALLKAGCRDLRIARLFDVVDPFLEVMADLMQQQTKAPPPMLTHKELFDLGACLKDALHCVTELQMPDALGHSDVNPGNIIVAPERCTFLDWAEAHVGHPFLTFEYLMSHLRRSYPALIQFEDAIRSSYARRWLEVLSPEHCSEALAFSPLVAVFAYAVAGNIWRDAERLQVPGFPGFLRSLTRRMKQEAESIQRRRVECLN